MTPTETQIARAERIADDIISSRATAGWTIAGNAALAAIMECEAWQDIESAPRDGTRVDLWMVDETGAGWREADAYWATSRTETFSIYDSGQLEYVTAKRDGWWAPNHDYDGNDGFCDQPERFYGIPKQATWKQPTHWRPLPAPPLAAAIRAGEQP